MTQGRNESRRDDVRRMFGRIAPRYDLLNRLMTFGQDQRWRKAMITNLCLPPKSFVLDLGAGTGDLAFEAVQQHPDALVIAADLTPEMILHGKQRDGGRMVQWIIADADHLPFDSGAFDAVVSGFLLRNLQNLDRSLAEQVRVLRDHGQWAALDTTPPANGVLKPFIRLYLHFVIHSPGVSDRRRRRCLSLPAPINGTLPPTASPARAPTMCRNHRSRFPAADVRKHCPLSWPQILIPACYHPDVT